MKQKIVFLFIIASLFFSCKKNKDCDNCIITVSDTSGNTIATYTKDAFLQINPKDSWCTFLKNADNTTFKDNYGNPIGIGKKSCN